MRLADTGGGVREWNGEIYMWRRWICEVNEVNESNALPAGN